jgi:hypothetical protein
MENGCGWDWRNYFTLDEGGRLLQGGDTRAECVLLRRSQPSTDLGKEISHTGQMEAANEIDMTLGKMKEE